MKIEIKQQNGNVQVTGDGAEKDVKKRSTKPSSPKKTSSTKKSTKDSCDVKKSSSRRSYRKKNTSTQKETIKEPAIFESFSDLIKFLLTVSADEAVEIISYEIKTDRTYSLAYSLLGLAKSCTRFTSETWHSILKRRYPLEVIS